MNFSNTLFACLLSLTFLACQSESSDSASTAETEPAPAAPAQQQGTTLPSLPVEMLENAYVTADFADFVFYEPSFSMSQDEPASIQQILSLIASDAPIINPNCKPIGRVNFQSDAVDVLVADLYLTSPCFYMVFVENEKPVYANLLLPQGVQYFNNTFEQVYEMQRKAQQGGQ